MSWSIVCPSTGIHLPISLYRRAPSAICATRKSRRSVKSCANTQGNCGRDAGYSWERQGWDKSAENRQDTSAMMCASLERKNLESCMLRPSLSMASRLHRRM